MQYTSEVSFEKNETLELEKNIPWLSKAYNESQTRYPQHVQFTLILVDSH